MLTLANKKVANVHFLNPNKVYRISAHSAIARYRFRTTTCCGEGGITIDGRKMYEKYEKLVKGRGMNNSQVAKATGVSKSSLQDWKTGRSVPKLDKLLKISQLFDVSVAYFIE